MHPTTRVVAFLLAAAIAVVGGFACAQGGASSAVADQPATVIVGGPAPDAGTPALPAVSATALGDPCSLLTAGEVSAALEVAVTAAQPLTSDAGTLGQQLCTWSSTDVPSAYASLSVVATAASRQTDADGGTYTARDLFEDTRAIYTDGVDLADLADLGAPAFRAADGSVVIALVGADGSPQQAELMVSVGGVADPGAVGAHLMASTVAALG